jgi:hypothetical protein
MSRRVISLVFEGLAMLWLFGVLGFWLLVVN